MSSVPLAALRLRLPKFEGPLDQYRKVVQLKALLGYQRLNQQRQQLNQQSLQSNQLKFQQEQQERARLQALYIEADYKLDKVIELAPKAGLGVQAYQGLIDRRHKRRQDLRKMTLDDLKIGKEKVEISGRIAGSILALSPDQRPEAVLQAIPSLIQQGLISPEEVQQYEQFAQLPPEQLEQTLRAFQLLAVDSGEQFKAEEKRKERTTKQKEFQSFYKNYRESKGLPKNARVEMEARISPEWKAWQGRTARTEKPSARDLSGREATLVEDEAVRALQAAGDDADRAVEIVNQSANIPARLKAKVRQRIRERVRPGAGAPSDIDELRGLLTGAGAAGRTITRQESAEGRTAINPETGEKVVYRGGKWVPVPK